MGLNQLIQLGAGAGHFSDASQLIASGARSVQIEGLSASAKAYYLAGLFREFGRTLFVVTYNKEQAERLSEDLAAFGLSDEEVLYFPAVETLLYEEALPDFRVIGHRLLALGMLAKGQKAVVVAPIHGALRKTLPMDALNNSRMSVSVGETLDVDGFLSRLVSLGYEREEIVDRRAQFSRRGGIIDVFPSTNENPVRIELFGDEVESIREFDSGSQRSVRKLHSLEILPARELLLGEDNVNKAAEQLRKTIKEQVAKLKADDLDAEAEKLSAKVEDDITRLSNLAYFDGCEYYLPYIHSDDSTIINYLPEDALVALDEPLQVRSHWDAIEQEVVEMLAARSGRGDILPLAKPHNQTFEGAMKQLGARQRLYFSLLARPVPWAQIQHHISIASSPMDAYGGHIDQLAEQIKAWLSHGSTIVAATSQDHRLTEILTQREIAIGNLADVAQLQPGVFVTHTGSHPGDSSNLSGGFKLPDAKLMVLTDSEIFGISKVHRPRRVFREGVPITTLLDLKIGDYVTHINHGIGIYKGLTTLKVEGVERDYLLLEYSGQDRLYVPSDQIDRVQKYIGVEGQPPQVHRLGGGEWARTTKRVKQSVREMAKELIELYAWRQASGGYSFGPDTPWQQEMEAAFPYQETPDQFEAINDVKHDLEKPKPMDRLICGDVGYGKTEVAIRAAFKAVNEGKQVAVLAPTTVLAQQHLNTFIGRLGAYPVTVDMLSRFRSRKEQKKTIEGLKIGAVDIVIGTHRMLSKDVEFKDLGLLIVDEEQRFGVGQKEKLKQLRKTVDVLAMTATPIPRTLHMSLSGIRDMSIINDPPEGRSPIKTYIKEADDEMIREAIFRELDRDGQIYFVHNRVENIAHVAAHVQTLVPYAKIEVAHGQMSEDDLERIMLDFYDRQFDVLVCTTIIESGLDIPNVNTIVINDADKMGLSQLYQLRGRVGRSDRQAYAYLLYKEDKILSEIAEKRLDAIKEFTSLGSGFKVAMRDLEIRGAGNLLGAEQHGQMAAVGFDLYCQLLSQAVLEMKGEEVEEFNMPPVDLPLDAHIPNNYISDEALRILFYKKLAAVKSVKDVQNVQEELEDRFGDPPRQVWNSLAILRLRLRAMELGIMSISTDRKQVAIRFAAGVRLPPHICKDLAVQHRRHKFDPHQVLVNLSSTRILAEVEDMVEVIAKALRRAGMRVAAG
ncbi:MAG: transcription-repair coupling factor [Armatimonadota bacterium]|nr:transcription-repair coupling factor [Armatimonadota bacterium]